MNVGYATLNLPVPGFALLEIVFFLSGECKNFFGERLVH